MKLSEAYQILGIPEGSDEAVAKKAFRARASKLHPDVNKDPNATDQFKKVNEAYQVISSGEASTNQERMEESGGFNWSNVGGFGGFNIEDILFSRNRNQSKKKRPPAYDINLQETISFRESVLGVTKKIRYKHNIKCSKCNGEGSIKLDNGCKKCKGQGVVVTQSGFQIMQMQCNCKLKFEDCTKCSQTGVINEEVERTINIPFGVKEGTVLNLGNIGHWIGEMMGGDQVTRVILTMHITPQKGLSIQDQNVMTTIDISLLQALQGCKKEVPTINGNKTIDIPKLIKNKDEVKIPKLGIGGKADQVVIININYPENMDELISFLTPKEITNIN